MALINCQDCNTQVSSKTKQCLKCGYPIDDIKEVEPVMSMDQVMATKKTSTVSKIIFGTIGAIFLFFFLSENLEETKGSHIKDKTYLSDETATYAAEKFVEDRLKAPSSADFDPYFKAVVTRDGDKYTVVSHVESENSFSAKTRNRYKVIFIANEHGGANLIDIIIE